MSNVYSWDEIKTHTSMKNRLWIVIKGVVYDVTQFALEHPGGGTAHTLYLRLFGYPIRILTTYIYLILTLSLHRGYSFGARRYAREGTDFFHLSAFERRH
jgi:hypothetical protein